ncbi:N-acetylmuramic acid 6-phosphate etherase [Mongoliitalea daihaiensis]|uniref:N-acetylmuramic acid 6-phosphate etherase n=1 Tax=Mongoliitalea daihaiensis TaxID=2782006 RepID=UPI001F27673B|nr:N-acetylmuramic acid 6-phosphate etherase [Mongoliitalea daihaiensis]UJP63698.1 N-acetylmuramic acid 6-phosphate etherase [Mongoliitalea daihaiensis]
MQKITEQSSLYNNLEQMSLKELLATINQEDQKVAIAVKAVISPIEQFMEAFLPRFEKGGRLIYIGAGTSGRLGILDASEIPPTYGMPADRVVGIIAGGAQAIQSSVENAEDDVDAAWKALEAISIQEIDTVIGIAASGYTPFVVGGVQKAREFGCLTACITNNPDTPLAEAVEFPIEIIVGPEVVTGSTRMKSGTAQKLVLNMISTSLMIKIGRVKDNKMVHMKLANQKLFRRGVDILVNELQITPLEAAHLLKLYGSVDNSLKNFVKSV